ncbi:hypothetical protein [Solemya elarraichensis gill symbiont]|uniref:Cytochrome P460 domain-containing protein n=1 Tax=Solemya elarraichensis gill symbiont TaxID=1918949 RepID=A0A1T2KT60_9GAMM|nr:hypothetical protein [Solemya elarraichensis gill symbiont]OOZ36033.1 hypothetical protein BOW52_10985 [Solemya elarraichensis gill symbiont]
MNRLIRQNYSLLAASILILGQTATAQDAAPAFFGGPDDVSYAEKLWDSLESNQLVGTSAINVFPFAGNQPHGAIQQVLDKKIEVDGKVSRVIVKRNHGGENISVKSIYSDPVSNLKAVTVMVKREAGYDSDNLDWFWAKYTPVGDLGKNPKGTLLAGRIGKNASAGCIACHRAIGGDDLETLTEK